MDWWQIFPVRTLLLIVRWQKGQVYAYCEGDPDFGNVVSGSRLGDAVACWLRFILAICYCSPPFPMHVFIHFQLFNSPSRPRALAIDPPSSLSESYAFKTETRSASLALWKWLGCQNHPESLGSPWSVRLSSSIYTTQASDPKSATLKPKELGLPTWSGIGCHTWSTLLNSLNSSRASRKLLIRSSQAETAPAFEKKHRGQQRCDLKTSICGQPMRFIL